MAPVLLFALISLTTQDAAQSRLPEALRVSDAQKLILHARGLGDQVYTCKENDGKYAWVLKAPDARLLGADGRVAGRHFAGPAWEASDGSRVVGKAVANAPSPDAMSIPWLRVKAVKHEGNGIMSAVSDIQRIETKGGKAPSGGCDSSQAGAEARVPYQAEYYFFAEAR